jgi:hypothetical protein
MAPRHGRDVSFAVLLPARMNSVSSSQRVRDDGVLAQSIDLGHDC